MDVNDLSFENVDDEVTNESEGWESESEQEDESVITEESSQEFIDNFGDKSGLESFLATKGISDIHSIKFEDDNGNIQNLDWDDLTEEERFNILSQEDPDVDLDDAETDLINRIRLSGMSINDFVNTIQKQGYDYARQEQRMLETANPPQYNYTVDDYDDDDLFLLDMQAKIEGITDEELAEALDNAKSNESLYQKQIAALRDEYKRLEDNKNAQEAAEYEQQQQQRFQIYQNQILSSINNFRNIGELDVAMEPDDAEELAAFMLTSDANGDNYFSRALQDPDTRVRLAWFALHGEDILNSISQYYKNQITNTARYNYSRGLADGQSGKSSPSVAVRRKSHKSNVKSLDDFEY